MGVWQLISLGLMGLVVVAWTVLWFRMLFVMQRHAANRIADEGAGFAAGIGIRLQSFGWFFTSPRNKRLRQRVFLVTLLLFAIIMAQGLISLHLQ
jgi:hypothetical protein